MALATGLAVFAAPSEACAREIEYRAPAECPAPGGVTSRIEARAPKGGPARLSIEKTKNGFHGDVVVGHGDSRVARSVDARSCGAVLEALELVLALSSDAEEPSKADDVASETESASANASPPASAPAAAEEPATVARSSRRMLTIGSTASYTSFSEEHTLFGGALFADVALPTRIADLSFLQPSFRAALGATFPNTGNKQGTIRPSTEGTHLCFGCGPVLTIVKSAFDLCPIGANLEGTVSLAACARGELGMLVADVTGKDAKAEARLWMAAGPIVRSRVMWGSGSIRPSFEVIAGLLAPLRRDRFHYDDYPTDVVAPWIWTVGFGGGLVFP